MTQHEIYQFLLCLITFTLLTVLSTVLVVWIVRLMSRLIDSGIEDEKIKKEYLKSQSKKRGKIGKTIDCVVLILFCAVFLFSFAFSMFVAVNEENIVSDVSVIRVVKSSSMSYINKDHKYLSQGQVTDQIQMFDLVLINKLPAENDLKVNDIIVYETDGVAIIHRIVAIEEPNAHHKERHFLLHGDANKSADYFPVLYSQMTGIYSGTRIPMVGNFVMFMQSPSGYLCILLLVFAIIAVPVAEKSIKKRINNRILAMGLIGDISDAIDKAEVKDKFSSFNNKNNTKTFDERLLDSTQQVRDRYNLLNNTLLRLENIRVIKSKSHHSYRCKRLSVARFTIRGKTLNIYLGLDPKEFENTKYIYIDESRVKKHSNYPMRIKLSSDRQVRWANELIMFFAKKHGITLFEKAQSAENEQEIPTLENALTVTGTSGDTNRFHLMSKNNRTFDEKLNDFPIAKERYEFITKYLYKVANIREIRGRKKRTFKVSNIPLVRFTIRGKTLNAFISLNPKDFENTKYIYTDASEISTYANYPMRVKVTSTRQTRWTIELIGKILEQKGVLTDET